MEETQTHQECPICLKEFSSTEIEQHVNKCLFLNSSNNSENVENQHKRKRSPSPNLKGYTPSSAKILTNDNRLNSRCISNNSDFKFEIPLTELLLPKSLHQFFGQNHLLSKNTFLYSLLEKNEIPNIILWGPPGCGKTSLANIIHEICKKDIERYKYVSFCAVDTNVSEIRNIIGKAKRLLKLEQKTVVFIDEIHRLSKKQQISLIAPLLKGEIILIGATTENPSFMLKTALLNSCKVIIMEKLESSAIVSIIEKALNMLNIYILDDSNTLRNMWVTKSVQIHRSAIKWLADTSDGDARIALNNLQLILQYSTNNTITISDIKNQIKKSHLLYDRNGEEHHNIISAMHESIKGYNDNAALYWTTRMLVGGEDPLFIARRLVRAASDDTGNKNPKALQLAVSTMQACQVMEAAESDVLLAQCSIYLARTPTDEQLKTALALAKELISKNDHQYVEVPLHLRNIPPKLIAELIDKNENMQSKRIKRSCMPVGFENVKFL